MNSKVSRYLSVIAVLLCCACGRIFADPVTHEVASFEFEGVTNAESVVISYNDDAYKMVYDTPNKTYTYLVQDIQCIKDTGYESVSFTAVEPAMGTEIFVLVTKSANFTDIRIGSKLFKFKVVRHYELQLSD